ncbi:peptidylprolyl isomerase [Arthrobacter pityocampae]|uniref:Peptidyl-prolyl cis-trans isomerase n=1 Tax=Arthrobacter pityocampae TaxID=547334 RepID=A0A2S5IZI9_9MICC|nr:FKBP-type peptidyl-prolyl cis-trans isomerase [Arthrobacter pityocampae]PPB49974.1 peptidylprolyl isomerase [Arthrobacter pityocampae]
MTDDLTGDSAGDSSGSSSGTSAGATGILESVEVSGGTDEEAPSVEFDEPLDITGVAARTVVDGDGDAIEAGEQVRYQIVALNAEDGEVLGDTYSQGEPQVLPVDDTLKEQDAELYEVLTGSKVGAQVAYTRPAPEAVEGQPATPEQLIVLKVISAEQPPPEPEVLSPADVKKLDDDDQLPTFTFGDEGAPEVTIPDNEPSDDLVVKVLKEGTGEEITETDTITAKYAGWRWEDGEQFDSSYERGEPIEFPLTGVIEGWTKGLAGQKVGSQLLLVIPGPWAYGDPAPQGQPSGTLVFFVEITDKADAE